MSSNVDSGLVNGLQHLIRAKKYFDTFNNAFPDTIGGRLTHEYLKKINWVLTNFLTSSHFDEYVRGVIRDEIKSDVFELNDIENMIPLIPASQRDFIIQVMQLAINGEKLKMFDDGK